MLGFSLILFLIFIDALAFPVCDSQAEISETVFGLPILISDNPDYGYPDETIQWDRVNAVFQNHANLRYNYGSSKLAILDTGLDEPTWTHLASKYPYYILEIKLIDSNGNYVSRYNAYDICDYKHGSVLTSLIVELLERNADQLNEYVYGSVYMFICAKDDFQGHQGKIDESLVEEQLQWIINFNNLYPSAPFRVISLSFGSSYSGTPDYYDEMQTLINQGCLIVAASGNYITGMLGEDHRISPATYSNIIGAGGIYGYPAQGDYDIYRMSTYRDPEPDNPLGHKDGSLYYSLGGLTQKTVDITAPSFYVKGVCDIDGDGDADAIKATGTSLSAPQVAVGAYLAQRASFYDRGLPISLTDFKHCLRMSAENDPYGRYLSPSDRLQYDRVKIPISNYGAPRFRFYSYRVGDGSLDIGDLIEYVIELS